MNSITTSTAADQAKPRSTASLSLIICTRNRASQLGRCLQAVARAARSASDVPFELVLVDNGSTDETKAVLDDWRASQSFRVKIIDEPRPGLSRARNAGLAVADHSIIAMTDDDCEIDTHYIRDLMAAFARDKGPTVRGGRVELGDPEDLPISIKTEARAREFRHGMRPGGFFMGANMAFSRAVYETIGPFDERFGAGARYIAAEDTDYIMRACQAKIPIYFDPSFSVKHFHGRRDDQIVVKLIEGYNLGDGALYAKHFFAGRTGFLYLYKGFIAAFSEVFGRAIPDPSVKNIHRLAFRCLVRGFALYAADRLFLPKRQTN